MTKEELQSFLPQKPERLQQVAEPKRQQLVDASYDVIGCIHDVYRQLGGGLPEYIYQEAFATVLNSHDIDPHKELRYYPTFNGTKMKSFLKMDFMVEREGGNIIIEAKAVEELTKQERGQLFGYMVGTGFPYGLLVNFANYPKPRIERYYFDKDTMTIVAF